MSCPVSLCHLRRQEVGERDKISRRVSDDQWCEQIQRNVTQGWNKRKCIVSKLILNFERFSFAQHVSRFNAGAINCDVSPREQKTVEHGFPLSSTRIEFPSGLRLAGCFGGSSYATSATRRGNTAARAVETPERALTPPSPSQWLQERSRLRRELLRHHRHPNGCKSDRDAARHQVVPENKLHVLPTLGALHHRLRAFRPLQADAGRRSSSHR